MNIRTIAELAKLLDTTDAVVRGYVKDLPPAVTLGRSKGYYVEDVKDVVTARYQGVINFLGLVVPISE
jgi:hypothetical protein